MDFDTLPVEDVPSVRYVVLTDRVFGAVTFVGILLADEVVEIAGYDIDPDYWEVTGDHPRPVIARRRRRRRCGPSSRAYAAQAKEQPVTG